MYNGLKSNQPRRIWVYKTFKIKKEKGRPNNSDILQNWFPQEIRCPLFNFYKFHDFSKSTRESCIMDWNLTNHGEFGSTKLLKLKKRRGDQIIQTFCKIDSPKKLSAPFLIFTNFMTFQKVLLNHAEYIEMQWMLKNLGL